MVLLLMATGCLAMLARGGIAATNAADVPSLDSTGWRGEATIKLEDRPYLLGENVHLQFGITNTQDEPVTIEDGGDYRGSPRPLRFKVLAYDTNGRRVRDPYSPSQEFMFGGEGQSHTIASGQTKWLHVPVGRYCDFQQPGEYTLRVYHDLGWDDETQHEDPSRNELPKGIHIAPVGEATITLAMPSDRQAKQLVEGMAAAIRDNQSSDDWRADSVDFVTLRHSIYFPQLDRLLDDPSDAVAAAAVRAISEIATTDATGALIRAHHHPSNKVANLAFYHLMGRLPVPRSGQARTVSRIWTQHGDHVAAKSWNQKHREKLLEIAFHLVRTNHYLQVRVSREIGIFHACRILQAMGGLQHYPDFASRVRSVITTNANVDWSVKRLSEAGWVLFCDGKPQPPQDLSRRLVAAGDLDPLTFLRLLKVRVDYRPEGWDERLVRLLGESSSSVRLFATQHVPFPFSKSVAVAIGRNIVDEHGSRTSEGEFTYHPPLQVASLEVAERSGSSYFLFSIQNVIANSKDEAVLAAARRAFAACTGSDHGDLFKQRYFRQDEAEKLFEKKMPAWSDEQLGVRFGVCHTGTRRKFRLGERVPLVMFVRNVSDKTLNVKLYADFFWFIPTVRDARDDVVTLEKFYVNGVLADISYHQTLKPGEAFEVQHVGLGLGQHEPDDSEPWETRPYWKEPVRGKYTLRQTHKLNVAVVTKPEQSWNRGWTTGKYGEFTTGKIAFEVVSDKPKDDQDAKPGRNVEPDNPSARKRDVNAFRIRPLPDDAAEAAADAATRTNALLKAIHEGNLKEVSKLADDPTAIPKVNDLLHVLWSPNVEVVDFLLARWKLEVSELALAVIHGNAKQVTQLLTRMSYEDRVAQLAGSKQLALRPSLLHLAALHGHQDVIKELARFGANTNDNGYHYAQTPLAVAAENGHVEVTKTLIRVGAKVNLEADYTALMRACVGRQPETTRVLLEYDANPNIARHDGQRALHLAAKLGSVPCVKLLLKHGADPQALAYGRDTALSYAERYKHLEVASLLRAATNQPEGTTPADPQDGDNAD